MRLFAKSRQATVFRAYLRGRMRAAGLLADAEAGQYADPALPTPMLLAFVLGALADVGVPLPSEAEVVAEVARRLLPAEAPDPPAAPPAVPAEVAAEETARVRPARWVGEPLPSGAS